MQKHIRAELIKMVIVCLGLLAIAVLAHNFIMTGFLAKKALNGSIIATFFFGIYLCFKAVFNLKNDQFAFSALVEAYEDIKKAKLDPMRDPYAQHYRCLQAGVVYGRPTYLGHFFEIVYEEMLRSKDLKLSVGTMQALVHGVDVRLAEERSVVNYMTGLLVFMGLIGAFIGLMAMVSSVGDILGTLGKGNMGSSGFTKLIGDLQGPLQGMSVGFSSSLFGLFSSMTLGLMLRFSGHAGIILKTEFEGWLAGVAQVDGDKDKDAQSAPAQAHAAVGGAAALPKFDEVVQAIGGVQRSIVKAQHGFEATTGVIERIVLIQAEQTDVLRKTSEQLDTLRAQQEDMKILLAKTANTSVAIDAARQDMGRAANALGARFTQGFQQVSERLEASHRESLIGFNRLINNQIELAGRMAKNGQSSPQAVDDMKMLGEALQAGLANGFAELAKTLDVLMERQGQLQHQLVALPAGAEGAPHSAQGQGDELRRLAQSIEGGMASGFGELSHAIEGAFVSYVELLKHTGGRVAASVPMTAPDLVSLPVAVGQDMEFPVSAAPEPVDHVEMMRRLYQTVATQYKPKTEQG